MKVRQLVKPIVERIEGTSRPAQVLTVAMAALAVILVFAVWPAGAGAGTATTTHGVQPTEVNLGGQANDCAPVGSTAPYEFRIVNPSNSSFTDPGPGGATFTISNLITDTLFDFSVAGGAVFDAVVKGGQKSTHFDFDGVAHSLPLPGHAAHAVVSDTGLHGPTKGNSQTNYYSTSHVTFCYGTIATLSGTVFNDIDIDGVKDTFESGEAGIKVSVYQGTTLVAGPTATDANGGYSFELIIGGTYTVCEEARANVAQTTPKGNTACQSLGSFEAAGHVVTLTGNSSGNDFGNIASISPGCAGVSGSGNPTFTAADGNLEATVTRGPDAGGGCAAKEFFFDANLVTTGDQIVVYGQGTGGNTAALTVNWEAAPAQYDANNNLIVPPTQILIVAGQPATKAQFCKTGEPNSTTPICLTGQVITTFSTSNVVMAQIDEDYNILGDPQWIR